MFPSPRGGVLQLDNCKRSIKFDEVSVPAWGYVAMEIEKVLCVFPEFPSPRGGMLQSQGIVVL